MSNLFKDSKFNGDISKWDVSNVTNMSYMFAYADSFNQSISKWNTSRVTDMYRMFCGASSFNQSLDKWNTSKVKDMRYIFSDSKLEGKEPSWVKKLETSRPSVENKRLYSTHF